MDFSKVKSLTIPEGVVTQIADAAGNVLWSAAEPCTVTILAFGITPNGNANVTLNGQTYSAKGVSITVDQNNPTPIAEVTVPSGTVMHCSALTTKGITGNILLNGTSVAQQTTPGVPITYDYVVNGNIKVALNDASSMIDASRVLITAIPEGHALVTIAGGGNSSDCYVTIDGTKYASATGVVVPIGTQITCFAKDNDGGGGYYGNISLNGSTILTDANGSGVSYNHTVNGNVTIKFSRTAQGGNITITEQ